MMSELEEIKNKITATEAEIASTEAKIASAEASGNESMLLMWGNILAEQTGVLKEQTGVLKELLKKEGALREREFSTGSASAKAGYFHARMTIERSKAKSGVRNQVYIIASKYVAFYYVDLKQSIYYSDVNLEISLLFNSVDKAHLFVNEMIAYLRFASLKCIYSHSYPQIFPDFVPELVFGDHYNVDEYNDSASQSTLLTVPPTLVFSSLTTDQWLMAIERSDHADFLGLNAYQCHLIGKAIDKNYEASINNIFFMSWAMHQRFDGLNCSDELKRVPLIAIRFESVGEIKVNIHGYDRQQANVVIECFDNDAYVATLERLKEPKIPNPSALEIGTFVFPEDIAEFIICITYKYEETKEVWKNKAPGEVVDAMTASELRTEASRVAKVKLAQQSGYKKKRSDNI